MFWRVYCIVRLVSNCVNVIGVNWSFIVRVFFVKLFFDFKILINVCMFFLSKNFVVNFFLLINFWKLKRVNLRGRIFFVGGVLGVDFVNDLWWVDLREVIMMRVFVVGEV